MCVCVYSALVNDGPVTIVIDSDVPSSKEAATDLEEKLPLSDRFILVDDIYIYIHIGHIHIYIIYTE